MAGKIHVVLTDIEGTVSSISFVRDVLFPYAAKHLESYLNDHGDEAAVAALIAETRTLGELAIDAPIPAVADVLRQWIAEDRKAPPLKALQGLIWRQGYESGELKAELYPDALAALRAWDKAGVPIYVYSSGSVEAQHLFFGFTTEGDLRGLFQDHFDTRTGSKLEAGSYQTICAITGYQADEVLFLTDSPGEVSAAVEAGVRVVAVSRDGSTLDLPEGVAQVQTFDQIPADLQPTP